MREFRTRKGLRLNGYDYNQQGAYFLTICVKNRHEMLGHIVGDAALGVPFSTQLSDIGEIVQKHIEAETVHDIIKIMNYVIMPNHIHLLVIIGDGTPRAASPTRASIPEIVRTIKSLTTRLYGASIWQRSYHDHIIRNEEEYQKIWNYIDTNPAKWEDDCFFVKR